MANTLNLTFIHPTDNSSIEAVCESSWSADFAISELIRQGFLKELPNPDKEEYRLLYKQDQTEFRGSTTFEQAGCEDNKVISVVIRPKAGNYTPGQGNGLLCAKCRTGAFDLFKTETYTDSNGKKTVTEFYRCRHCGNVWEHEVYKEF